jgi:NAD(P)H-hydrate repair Nnr-like enzyme with NAD(P)H-hydrate epimerase domain
MGPWNRLTRHQDRSDPFRLTRVQTRANREEIVSLPTMRRQGLDGFVDGMFGGADELDLSEPAVDAMTVLSTLRAMFVAIEVVAGVPTKAANEKDFAETLDRMREMTLTAEKSIHAVVLACKRARASDFSRGLAKRSTLH